MAAIVDPQTQRILEDIGKRLRELRKDKTDLNYIDFAKTVGINKKTYYAIEKASKDYNITSFIKVLSYYPDDTVKDFIQKILL